MATSDLIAKFILKTIDDSTQGIAEIQRSALAEMFSCVPSQINYVLSTRFSPERGFAVESRRGGGGYIRISRVQESTRELIMHTVDAVGESLDAGAAESTIHSIRDAELLDEATARVMLSAVGNAALKPAEGALRDQIRANLLKHMLVTYVAE